MTFRAAAPVCPACTALLEGSTLFDVHVERCPACAGAWLDAVREPLATLALPDPRIEAGPRCPRCERALARTKLGAADVLACDACGGIFIAHGAFGAVLGEATSAGTMPFFVPNHARVLAVLRALSRSH